MLQSFFTAAKSALGQRRLGVRVPPDTRVLDQLGIDLPALQRAKLLDYVNAGIDFNSFLPSMSDFAKIRAALPPPFPLLWEVSGFQGKGKGPTRNCSSTGHWRLADEQLATCVQSRPAKLTAP